jgi:hypothetical protein
MFEEPIENTHFFIVVPDTNSLLGTFISRFYVIKSEGVDTNKEEAEKFISMSLQKRIDFIKELLPKKDEDNEEEVNLESNNSKALKFLNALEAVLHRKFVKNSSGLTSFEHIFKVRKFLRMPGSSVKTLMESLALVIPEK